MSIHLQILYYLDAHKDELEYFDLWLQFPNIEKKLLEAKARELQKENYIEIKTVGLLGVTIFNNDGGSKHTKLAEPTLLAKIKLKGIDYLKQTESK